MAYAIKVTSSTKRRIYVALRGSNLKNGTSYFKTKKEAEDFIKEKLYQKSLNAKVVKFPE